MKIKLPKITIGITKVDYNVSTITRATFTFTQTFTQNYILWK